MNGLFDKFFLSIVEHLVDKPSGYWNIRSYWRVFQAVGQGLKSYGKRKPFWTLKCKIQSWIADRTAIENLADRTAQKQ